MNRTFLSALRANGGPGTAIATASGTIPAHVRPPADAFPQGVDTRVFAIAPAVKTVQVRVASAAQNSSSVGAFFGNLFGSKPDTASPNVREGSARQTIQTKSQAPTAPGASPAQIKTTAITKGPTEGQRTTDPARQGSTGEPRPPDAGGARTSDLLIGAVLAMPTGTFQNRFGAWQ